MTYLLVFILTALLLFIAWLLGQLPTAAKRMTLAFAASWLGYAAVWQADRMQASDTMKAGIAIALLLAAVTVAIWMLQPWVWGIDDWLADLDAQAAEVQVQP